MPITLKLNRRRVYAALGLVAALLLWWGWNQACWPVWLSKGVRLAECPDGTLRASAWLEASGLVREGKGAARVGALAWYTLGDADAPTSEPVRRLEASLSLVDAAGRETALEAGPWTQQPDHALAGDVKLPAVPDGDYRLRAKVSTKLGDVVAEAPLALYAPARVHVLTDRPLYEPGNLVRFRALALRARDLSPLEGRPGTWMVETPSGERVLEERAPAGPWGVVAGSLPLDEGAETGDWKVRWTSGDASDQATFRVEPFTLPRFRVEASAVKPFHGPGDRPQVKGSVVYSSGAPVGGATISIEWTPQGDWPPPLEWLEGGLPASATADAAGRFKLELPVVPRDLRGRVTLLASLSAVDPAGDRVSTSLPVLLSEDAIQVAAVTELRDGLVQGFNNRLYLRVADAAGTVLPGAQVHVRRAWDPADPGLDAVADEDGVAALQIDPGPPVNVVIPPMPVRKAPRKGGLERGESTDLVSGDEPSLADQRALDGWLAALESCARFVVDEAATVTLGVRADPSGAVLAAVGDSTPLARCLAEVARTRRLAAGGERLLSIQWTVAAPPLPRLDAEIQGLPDTPPTLQELIYEAALDARTCLPAGIESGSLPRQLAWRVRAGSKEVSISWLRAEGYAPESAVACVQRKYERLALRESAADDALGVVRFGIQSADTDEESAPEATTMLGYELLVSAKRDGKDAGSTKLRLGPGGVPPVRLRATPVLAKAGESVEVEILRGPDFSGDLPEKLFLTAGEKSLESKVDAKKRTAGFQLPADAEGWYEVSWYGARALVYVKPAAQLTVEVKPEKDRYAPGQTASLAVFTTAGGRPTKAAVGLFGVDESLSQLAALPGPDELARVRAPVQTQNPAFGVLDGQALAMGRVRGANAAAATILGVGDIARVSGRETPAAVQRREEIDAVAELTDAFYDVLTDLHARTREWEKVAPAGELMHPATMAKLWSEALDAAAKRGAKITDAWGRRLKLHRLPPDLLALTDPRAVVVAGTRLPEDVENWAAFVAKEKP